MVMIDKDIEARVRDWTGETGEAAGSLARGFCSQSKGIFEGLARCLMGNLDVEKYFGDVKKYEMGKPAEESGKNKKAAGNESMGSSSAKAVDKKEALEKLKEEMGDKFPENLTADDLPEDIARELLAGGDVSEKLQKFIDRLGERSGDSGDEKEVTEQKADAQATGAAEAAASGSPKSSDSSEVGDGVTAAKS